MYFQQKESLLDQIFINGKWIIILNKLDIIKDKEIRDQLYKILRFYGKIRYKMEKFCQIKILTGQQK